LKATPAQAGRTYQIRKAVSPDFASARVECNKTQQAPRESGVTRFDLAIIGGGINGCGIARDAAGRGLTVHLSEMDDLASGTSSRSSGLIHGGLRYLEYYDFRLVREALKEREVLLRIAPHVVQPLRIVVPYRRGLRPAWLLWLGLFIYDHMGRRERLPRSQTLDLANDPAGSPLKPGLFRIGFAFSDCRGDDARLVVLNARDAADHGAVIRTRAKVVMAMRCDGHWAVTVEDQASGRRDVILARALVNATGPWRAGACGWSRDLTSWCRNSSIVASLICFRTPTAAWCSLCRTPAPIP
jgi:glycerol-3-phosphate dehydrogenase